MPVRRQLAPLATVLLPAVLAWGCAGMAPQRYAQFAAAGGAYVAAFDSVAEQAARMAVETDSRLLERARPDLTRADRLRELSAADSLLGERLSLIQDLRRHAALLNEYFASLSRLAGSEAPILAGSAAAELGDSLSALGKRLETRTLGGTPLGAVLGPVAQVVVGRSRSLMLRRELRARAGLIARELALQEATLQALSAQLRHELELDAQRRRLEEVVRPYAADAPLAADWRMKRWNVLSSSVETPGLDRAAAAARRMREAFKGLVEGKLGKDDLRFLIADLKLVRSALTAIPSP